MAQAIALSRQPPLNDLRQKNFAFFYYICAYHIKKTRKKPINMSLLPIEKRLLYFIFSLCFLICGCEVSHGASKNSRSKANKPAITLMIDSVACPQCFPFKGKVISPFGYRGRHNHTGTDIKLQKGDTVRAAFSGIATKACPYSGYGNLVILKHANNVETYYSHLSKCLVQMGDTVQAGDVVGLGGCTGRATTNHLHFEIRVNHVPKNAEHYFDFCNNTIKKSIYSPEPVLYVSNKKEPDTKVVTANTDVRISDTKENNADTKSSVTPTEIFISDTATSASDETITIKKGDTLYSLAKRYGTTVKQLQDLNKMENSNLSIGMILKLK